MEEDLAFDAYYAVGNIACIGSPAHHTLPQLYGVDLPAAFSSLKKLVVLLILFFLSDSAWVFVMAHSDDLSSSISYAITTVNVILITIASYYWFCFCKNMVHEEQELREKRWLVRAPIILSCIGYVLYYGTEFDLSNIDLTSPRDFSFLLLLAIPILYAFNGSWRCFRYAMRHYEERGLYLSFSFFAVMPTIASVLQIPFWKIPLTCYTATASIMFTYLILMENLISKDALTQIVNRHEMARYLARKLENPSQGAIFFLLMMDVDDFKDINDGFGHVEGDRALKIVSMALRRTEERWGYSFFPARFGGDEFIAIGECPTEEDARGVNLFLRTALKDIVDEEEIPYDIEISIGLAFLPREGGITLPKFVESADRSLYEEKRCRKVRRGRKTGTD